MAFIRYLILFAAHFKSFPFLPAVERANKSLFWTFQARFASWLASHSFSCLVLAARNRHSGLKFSTLPDSSSFSNSDGRPFKFPICRSFQSWLTTSTLARIWLPSGIPAQSVFLFVQFLYASASWSVPPSAAAERSDFFDHVAYPRRRGFCPVTEQKKKPNRNRKSPIRLSHSDRLSYPHRMNCYISHDEHVANPQKGSIGFRTARVTKWVTQCQRKWNLAAEIPPCCEMFVFSAAPSVTLTRRQSRQAANFREWPDHWIVFSSASWARAHSVPAFPLAGILIE